MKLKKSIFGGALALALGISVVSPALADDAEAAIKARQGLMRIYAFNLGKLGGMAKGAVEYDSALAQTAANNLLAAATFDQTGMWPAGTDITAMPEKTAAKSEIWSTYPAIADNGKALAEAAAAMAAVAGTDLASLQGAMGDLGKSCGGCHKLYREKE